MKVYELIQELSQYKADTEVVFHVKAGLDLDVIVDTDDIDLSEDRNREQEVTAYSDINEDFDFDDIGDYEKNPSSNGKKEPHIQINLSY